MCQYSADGHGTPVDWHLVHLGQLALGGAGLVLTEATAVSAEGRISPWDTGIWTDAHVEAWAPIVRFVRSQGTRVGIQLAHAGRKASTAPPWEGGGIVATGAGGWETMGPSPLAFGELPAPREMTGADLTAVCRAFVDATRRALAAGFEVIELHAAHGYLLHQFLSPISNRRSDAYGGSWEGRVRFPLEVVSAVRDAWPEDRPLLVRVSATDWAPEGEEGWTIDDTVALAPLLAERGVDLVDCSSGGNIPRPQIPLGPGYQVEFASVVRAKTGMPTGAVGMITEPAQAEAILAGGDADAVLLARALLAEPTWPRRAAAELGDGAEVRWPPQYLRAKPRPTP
jgi:2,4-dienoyl-CoA reductase-like NADH-dependent reductase (Old Yellow Enzyme family)